MSPILEGLFEIDRTAWRPGKLVSARITPLRLEGFDLLPKHARRCVFWEVDPDAVGGDDHLADPEFEKEAWLSMVMLEWGSCGLVATTGPAVPGEATEEDRGSGSFRNPVDPACVGYVLYAPPHAVPRALRFPSGPVSADAVLLTSMGVESDPATDGLQHELVARVVAELIRRGVRALEAFGRTTLAADLLEAPAVDPAVRAAVEALGDCSFDQCMIAADFLQEVGFVVVSPHPYFPRLRLELTKGLGWKAEVEAALERLLESSQLEQPVGAGSTISAQPAGG